MSHNFHDQSALRLLCSIIRVIHRWEKKTLHRAGDLHPDTHVNSVALDQNWTATENKKNPMFLRLSINVRLQFWHKNVYITVACRFLVPPPTITSGEHHVLRLSVCPSVNAYFAWRERFNMKLSTDIHHVNKHRWKVFKIGSQWIIV